MNKILLGAIAKAKIIKLLDKLKMDSLKPPS